MPTDSQRRNLASAHHAEVQGLNERIALLEQQLVEARKDAERYRFLCDFRGHIRDLCFDGEIYQGKSEFDKALDAAISSTQEQT